MKRKINILILIIFLFIDSLYSIGFGFHAFEIRTSPDFSNGVFPTSLLYQFDFPVPNIIGGNTTELNFRIDNGLSFKTLRQDPITGEPFSFDPDNTSWNYPKEYMSIYDEMNLVFGQGMLKTHLSDNDLIKLWMTFDIRFENAYERLDYLYDSKNSEGLFLKTPQYTDPEYPYTQHPAVERFEHCSWIGQPELKGNRSSSNMYFSFGLDINLMQDKITRRNGLKNSFWVRLNPKWFDIFQSNTEDFLLFWDQLHISYTPFAIHMNGLRDTTWISFVLDNITTYRYITGLMIPEYIQGGNIFGARALNTEHVLTNRTSFTVYGPQINSYDCYPYISLFFDVGLSFGKILNTINTSFNTKDYMDVVMSWGVKFEFIVFNMCSVYCEYGQVINNTQNINPQAITRIGFSFGV